jgi:hypothetical protein
MSMVPPTRGTDEHPRRTLSLELWIGDSPNRQQVRYGMYQMISRTREAESIGVNDLCLPRRGTKVVASQCQL